MYGDFVSDVIPARYVIIIVERNHVKFVMPGPGAGFMKLLRLTKAGLSD